MSIQMEPCIKTLRSALSAEIYRRYFLSGGIQRRAFTYTPEQQIGNLNLNKYFIFSSRDRTHNQSLLQPHIKFELTTTAFIFIIALIIIKHLEKNN